jgi:small subunit ribosomal protein S6
VGHIPWKGNYPVKRNYEITVILRPDPNEDTINEQIDEVQGWVQAGELGTITKLDRWGRRKLAYEIDKQREGYYLLIYAEMQSKGVPELERNLTLAQYVLRHMLIRPD